MEKELEKLKKEWETKKDYERNALRKVYLYNLQFRKENPEKYPYNADILDFILEKESIPQELQDHLKTEIYLSQQQLAREREKELEEDLQRKGFVRINPQDKGLDGKKIEFVIDARRDLCGVINKRGRLSWISSEKVLYAFEPRHTRSGYRLDINKIFVKVL